MQYIPPVNRRDVLFAIVGNSITAYCLLLDQAFKEVVAPMRLRIWLPQQRTYEAKYSALLRLVNTSRIRLAQGQLVTLVRL